MYADTFESKGPRILFFGGGWPTNIGNAFIDLGAIALLRIAFPDAHIAFASGLPRWHFHKSIERVSRLRASNTRPRRRLDPLRRLLGLLPAVPQHLAPETLPSIDNALVPAGLHECDLAVYSGNAATEIFVTQSGPTMLQIASTGIPIVLLGVGGSTYCDEERTVYTQFLRQLNPLALVSRDSMTYEAYRGTVQNSFDGIDCGFFLPEAYQPIPLSLAEYIALAFDYTPEPELDTGEFLVVRAHHEIYGPAREDWIDKANTLISDLPYDYLALYAGAREVHTDRVHACVAALAYGRPARLYSETARAALLDAAGAMGIRDQVAIVDQEWLFQKKRMQVEFVRSVVAAHFAG